MTNALDRITAERVMGYTVSWADRFISHSGESWNQVFVEHRDQCRHTPVAYWKEASGNRFKEVESWSPSTDIAATFEVVDALRAEGWRFALEDIPNGWEAAFTERTKNGVAMGPALVREHKDRLTAILLAALAVKGVTDEEVRAACKEQA